MKSLSFSFLLALSMSTSALAGSDVWYTTPEQKGECGDECYVPPSAWIDDEKGLYSFGVTCDSRMVLGGSIMEVPAPPFSETIMVVDNKTIGRFSVQNGLSDVYLLPKEGSQLSLKDVQENLQAGGELKLLVSGKPPIQFSLSGSRVAVQYVHETCKRL